MVLTSNAQFQLICTRENPNMFHPNLFRHSAGRGWLTYISCTWRAEFEAQGVSHVRSISNSALASKAEAVVMF